jgi:glutamate synthase (NADPH/NADH) large chain
MVDLEPLPAEEEVSKREYGHANDLETSGWVEVLDDMTRYDVERLRLLITRHARLTGSKRAEQILADWPRYCAMFRKVMPLEYRRALTELEKARTMQAAE